jgi:hypothetical protein
MPRRKAIDPAAVDGLFAHQERLARHHQLTTVGLPISTVISRIRPEGPWQRLLPGVVLSHRGTPTTRERRLGALLFCGEGAVLTGLTSLSLRGVRAARSGGDVHILIPEPRQRSSYDFVVVQRARHMPAVQRVDGLPVAPVARAVVDACRRLAKKDAVRELVAEVVQRGMCSVAELTDEVRAGARQRSALSRRVLAEIDAGVRSVAEIRAREVISRAGLPAPAWNIGLWSSAGEFIASPDAYWASLGAALQIDSMRWHLSPSQYQRTQERQRAMTTYGVLVLPVAPDHILNQTELFEREMWSLLATAGRRPAPGGIYVAPPPGIA